MSIYYGETKGFEIRHRIPTTTTEFSCNHCDGTGKTRIRNYDSIRKAYNGPEWALKLKEYIETEDLSTVDSFYVIAETSSTYGPGSSIGTCIQYDSYTNGSFSEWWEKNKDRYL